MGTSLSEQETTNQSPPFHDLQVYPDHKRGNNIQLASSQAGRHEQEGYVGGL